MEESIKHKSTITNVVKYTALVGYLMVTNLMAKSEIYVTLKDGNYDQKEIWSPEYPGNIIKESDTVVITKVINQNTDVVIKGTVIVQETGILSGDRHLIIIKSGTLLNLGASEFAKLTNRGAIYNQQNIEVLLDFVNSGNVINYNDIIVGNKLDNTGMITGKDGKISAERKFINSRTGTVKGYIDLCSNDFLNVEGGKLDSETITFCNNPIFNSHGMMASHSDRLHFENSVSAVSIKTGIHSPF